MNKTQRIYKNNVMKMTTTNALGQQNPYKQQQILKSTRNPSNSKQAANKFVNRININEQLADIVEDQVREQQCTDRAGEPGGQPGVQGSQGTQGNQGAAAMSNAMQIQESNVVQPQAIVQIQPELNQDLQRIEQKIDLLMEQQKIYGAGSKLFQAQHPVRRTQRDWKHVVRQGKTTRIAGISQGEPIYEGQRNPKRAATKSQHISTFLMSEIPHVLRAEGQRQVAGRLKTAGYEQEAPPPMGFDAGSASNSRGGRRAKNVDSLDLQSWQGGRDQQPLEGRQGIRSQDPSMRGQKQRPQAQSRENRDLQSIGEYLKKQQKGNSKHKTHYENSESLTDQPQSYDAKIKNLKKMYNLQVKNDYSSYDPGAKTSIRNKKSRASHDANFAAQAESTKQQAGKNVFTFERMASNEKAGDQTHSKKKSHLASSEAHPEQNLANVSRSMRVTKMAGRGASLFTGFQTTTGQTSALVGQSQVALVNNKKFISPNKHIAQTYSSPSYQHAPTLSLKQQQAQQLQPLSDNRRPPISVSSQERPMQTAFPMYDQRLERPERRDQGSNQKARERSKRNDVAVIPAKPQFKKGKMPLEPLKKVAADKTRNEDELRDVDSYDGEAIENVSDYEQGTPKNSAPGGDRKVKAVRRMVSNQVTTNRLKNNQSPERDGLSTGLPPFAPGTGPSSKTKANKFENAAARYKAEIMDVMSYSTHLAGGKNQGPKPKHQAVDSSEQFLLAESKEGKNSAQVSKISSDHPSREAGHSSTQQVKQKLSPYTQVFNATHTPASSNGFGTTGAQGINKRQLAQRQQRALMPPSIQVAESSPQHQTMTHTNQLKVQRAYKNAVGPIINPAIAQNKKPGKPGRQKKEHSVKSAIDKINLKIDDLKDNLQSYEQNIDLTLKEIPKDIRSMNNSNFNNSSSRHQNPETDRNSKQLDKFTNRTSYRGIGPQENQMVADDLSEATLKTILDFHSDRAQTQQRNRNKNMYRQSNSHMSQTGSQLPPNYQTSRHSKSRQGGGHNGIAGMVDGHDPNMTADAEAILGSQGGDNAHDLKAMNPQLLNMTHDEIQRYRVDDDVARAPDDVLASLNLTAVQHSRKGFNLTNMSNILKHGSGEEYREHEEVNDSSMIYKQKTERHQKTSFTNLQAYFQQRGINNNTNLSAALSINNSAYGVEQRAGGNGHVGMAIGTVNLSAIGSSNLNASGIEDSLPRVGHNGIHAPISIPAPCSGSAVVNAPSESPKPPKGQQNFYPPQAQSRLSQKSAIFEIAAAQPSPHHDEIENNE